MKKIFFAVMLVIMALATSCKQETKTDPTTPTTPVVSDSANFSLYIYATAEQMRYFDYCAYLTLNGAQEQKLELTSTVPYDSTINYRISNSCILSGISLDSIKIYRFDFRTKKGEQSLRFYGEKKDTSNMSDNIHAIVSFGTYPASNYVYSHFYGTAAGIDTVYAEVINKEVNKFYISY